jgi:hypothetical protein
MKFINKYHTNQLNLEKFNSYLNDYENEEGLSIKTGRTISDYDYDEVRSSMSSNQDDYQEIKNILNKKQFLNNERFLKARYVDANLQQRPSVIADKKNSDRLNLSVNNFRNNYNNSYLNQHLKKSQTQMSKYKVSNNKQPSEIKIQHKVAKELNKVKNETLLTLKINIYLDRFKKST